MTPALVTASPPWRPSGETPNLVPAMNVNTSKDATNAHVRSCALPLVPPRVCSGLRERLLLGIMSGPPPQAVELQIS